MQFDCPRVIRNGGFALIQSVLRFRATKVQREAFVFLNARPSENDPSVVGWSANSK
jgi:hypothetical protein